MVDIVIAAIPVFFVLMGVELIVGRLRGRPVFRGPDVATDLALGTMQTLANIVGAAVLTFGYATLYEHRLSSVDVNAWWAWPAVLVGVDFFYYWFHRAAHRINIAWASHAPHHSSEDYNLAVALRQGPVQAFFSRIFYLPLAVAGFPIEMFALSSSINTLYQFWIHTEQIGRLPAPLEFIFNTPSNHRVHHGVNGKYIDRNHGGILIIWDRIFGTYQREDETPKYGTVKQVATWNPLAAAVAPFADIARMAMRAPRLVDKVRVWFMPPEWLPEGVTRADVDAVHRPKFDARPARAVSRYVTPMFVVTLLIVIAFLVGPLFIPQSARPTYGEQCLAIAWIVLSLTSLGALLDGRRWAKLTEAARLAALPVVVAVIVWL